MGFPASRPRRLRRSELIRDMVRETRLSPKNFIYPLFVCPGEGIRKEIGSMPGNFHLSVDRAVDECRVAAIRKWLDRTGFADTAVLAYAAKYASAFYGPFREAADSAPQFGDRRAYQMDPANQREALREVALDIEEGADMVMVKPAMPYLDVIRAVTEAFDRPVAAYHVP